MGITTFLAQHILNLFSATGYFGLLILMAMESMIFPVPSEAVLPPAGLLVFRGEFSFWTCVIASTIGSLIGSLISYAIGKWGGKPFIDKFGKYFLLSNHDLEFSEKFFTKYGEITIFIARFIPVVRHFISIPAGAGKMNFYKFTLYTIIGAGLWNSFLLHIGNKYGQKGWDIIIEYSDVFDKVILGLLILAMGLFIYKHLKNNKRNAEREK